LTGGSVARSDGWGSNIEDGGYVDVVPFFLGEGVNAKITIRTTEKDNVLLTPSSFGPSF
jgi:hypothetical protein